MINVYLSAGCMFLAVVLMLLHRGIQFLGTCALLLGASLGVVLGYTLRTWVAHNPFTPAIENRMTIVMMVVLVLAVMAFTYELRHQPQGVSAA